MARMGQVHWHEGLFLQPHHLQHMQRQLTEELANERRLGWPYPYGIIEYRLSGDALENKLVQFDLLRVVMPSGLIVDVPENAELPTLDIKNAFDSSSAPVTVHLAVPLWYGSRANAIERGSGQDARVKRLYRVQEAKWFDENTGENPQPIEVRGINARLMFEDDDHTDMEWLPVVRIGRGTGEEGALPRQDPLFIPPCLVLNGSPILRELMRDLANAVDANRTALLQRITRGGAFSFDTIRGSQFEQILRLRTLGRYSGRLPALVNAPVAAPFEVYLELRGLLGELEALYPESEQASVADYDHENPAIAFHELCSKIRRLLPGKAEAAPVLKVPFRLEAGTLVADLTDEHLTRPNEYFLGIRTRQDPKQLSRLVEDPDQFKLMSKSLAKKAIYGVKLSEERFPPYALTGGPDVHYFRLLVGESKRMWEQIQREKAVAVTFPGVETADYAITLWMTLPQMDAGKHDSS